MGEVPLYSGRLRGKREGALRELVFEDSVHVGAIGLALEPLAWLWVLRMQGTAGERVTPHYIRVSRRATYP